MDEHVPAERTEKALPDAVLTKAIEIAETGDLAGCLYVVFAEFGVDLPNTECQIKVTNMVIPEDQWRAIGTALTASFPPGEGLGKANLLMDWMNWGPSGYIPLG